MQSQLEVDNSQVIVSNDERHAFRLILTTSTRYFNGIREFSLYFVEYLRPKDFGDPATTLVLKGLELCCRFRFLFLEKGSEFSPLSIRMALPNQIHELVRSIERELNLLQRDAMDMNLDKPNNWADFLDSQFLLQMSVEWRPLESRIREACVQIRGANENSEALPGLTESLAATIEQVEATIRPLNTQMISGLTNALKKFCSCP